MELEIHIDKIDDFLQNFAKQFNAEVINSTLKLPANLGKGYLMQMQFNKDVFITYYEVTLNEMTTVIRKKSNFDNIVPIIFWISNSNITQEINTEKKNLGKDSINGIFLPSNSIETKYVFPANMLIKNITIFITKDWLRKNINKQNDYINNCILSTTDYFLFEEITYQMTEVIDDIESIFKNNLQGTLSKLSLQIKTLLLANMFFDKILHRSLNDKRVNITQSDIEKMFVIKAIIVKHYNNIPPIDRLAKQSGINKRKMQKLFKQVFGKSIYQYALTVRMNEAKKLLQSKKHNVSEVGYMVGYTNISHFIEKFKRHFGITPKSFLLSI